MQKPIQKIDRQVADTVQIAWIEIQMQFQITSVDGDLQIDKQMKIQVDESDDDIPIKQIQI